MMIQELNFASVLYGWNICNQISSNKGHFLLFLPPKSTSSPCVLKELFVFESILFSSTNSGASSSSHFLH